MASETSKLSVTRNDAVAQAAFKVALGGVLGLIGGLASQVVVAWIFGASADLDAYLTAVAVPVYLWAVLVGSLPFVFIPAFIEDLVAGEEGDAWALAGRFVWLTASVLLVIAIGVSLFGHEIIDLAAPGLSAAKADLAARMLTILIFSLPLTGLATLTAGIQNARNSFFWPASASGIGSLGNVVILLVLSPTIGPLALAWGYVASQALRACVTLAPVLRHGWTKLTPVSHGRVRDMARLMAPFIVFGILIQSTPLFERYFASGLPDGQLSYLGYAYKISGIMVAVLAEGLATAILPAMARAHAQDGEVGLVAEAEYGFRLTSAVAFPAIAVLSAVAVPVVTVLFERGAFQHTTTLSVARILPMVIIADVVFRMLGNVIGRTFYITKDTLTAPMVSTLASVLYILLARIGVHNWGYVGLALAQPLYSGLAILVLFVLLTRKLKFFHTGKLLQSVLTCGAVSLVAFLGARAVSSMLAFLPALIQSTGAFIVAVPLYIVILLRIDRDMAISTLEMMGVQRLVRAGRGRARRIAETTFR
jgi:putative peptidoglycan lipid II flippase